MFEWAGSSTEIHSIKSSFGSGRTYTWVIQIYRSWSSERESEERHTLE